MNAYLAIGIRRKWWIILTTLGLFIGTVVFAHRLPDIYRAETVILVDPQQVPDKYVAVITTGDIAGRLSTLEEQVLSPSRLKTLVESVGLFPDPSGKLAEKQVIHALQKSITVETIAPGAGKTGSFRIAISSKNRNMVAPVANRLAQMFIEENLKVREEVTQGTADFLESQVLETKAQLDEKNTQLSNIKTHNVMDLPESKAYHLEALANLRTQVQGIQDKIQQSQRDVAILQSMLASGAEAPTVEVDAPGGTDTGGGYQTELQKLETKLSELKSHYGPSYPDVRRTQSELDKLKAKIAAGAADQNSQPLEDLKPAIQPKQSAHHNPVIESQIEQLQEQIQEATKSLTPLQQQIDLHTAKLEQIPVFEEEIDRLQEDYDSLKRHYADLQDKEQAAKISHALEIRQQGERFVVLDAAVTPEGPSSPNRLLISLAGLFGGLFAGVALAVTAEMNDRSVRSDEEAAAIFGNPVLTEIPLFTSGTDRLWQRLRQAGLLAGTIVGSAAFGFLLSIIADKMF